MPKTKRDIYIEIFEAIKQGKEYSINYDVVYYKRSEVDEICRKSSIDSCELLNKAFNIRLDQLRKEINTKIENILYGQCVCRENYTCTKHKQLSRIISFINEVFSAHGLDGGVKSHEKECHPEPDNDCSERTRRVNDSDDSVHRIKED